MATAAAGNVASLVFVVDGTAQMTLGQPYVPGSGSFLLSTVPAWPAASPQRPLAITLIERATYAQGPLEIATMYAVTGVAGPVCTIGWIIEGVDQAYAAGDFAESRVGAAAVNGAALILAYDGSSVGQVLTSTGPASPPRWQDPTGGGGGGGSGTVSVAGAGQLGYYAAGGATISGLSLGSNLSIAGGMLNAAGGGGGSGTINPGLGEQLGYYSASGATISGLSIGANLSITGGMLNAAGASGTINAGASNQIGFYAAAGTAISPLSLGSNLSIAGGVLNAASAGSGTVNSGIGNQLGFYAASGTAISGLNLGTNLAIAGNTLNATSASTGTVVPGTTNQLGYYAADGISISGLTLGANLSISGGVISASAGSAGTGTINPGVAYQLGYYAADGTVISGVGVGSNLSISGGLLNAAGGGTIAAGTIDQLGYYAAGGTAISGLNLGTNLSITGNTLNAAAGGSGTVVAGQGGQLGYYSANGTTISGVNVGANLSVAGGVLSAAGSGTVNSGTTDQLGYYPAGGTAISGLTLGSLLSISGGVLNAAPGGSGTVNSGIGNQLGYYAANGTTISGVGLGSNLSISGGLLNATGGGSGTVNPGTTNQLGYYSAAGNSISGLTLGSNLSIAGGVLNATTTGGGSGTVMTVSILTANGFSGTIQNPNTTPAITLGTGVTGLLKGVGGGMVAGVAGVDYQAPLTLSTAGTSGAATLANNVLNIPQYATGGGTGPTKLIGGVYTGGTAVTGASTAFTALTAGSTLAGGRADIPANTLAVGDQIWVRANGVTSSYAGVWQFQLHVVLDFAATPIVLLSHLYPPFQTPGTNMPWTFQAMIVVRSIGTAGLLSGSGNLTLGANNQSSLPNLLQLPGQAPVAVDTTVPHTPTLRFNWLATNGASFQLQDLLWAIVPGPAATAGGGGGTPTGWVGGLVTGGVAATNTTTNRDLVGTGTLVLGRGDIPAATLALGDQIWFRGHGLYTFPASGPTLTMRLAFDVGTTPIFALIPLVAITPPNLTNAPWTVDGMLIVRGAGPTGTVSGWATFTLGSTATTSAAYTLGNAAGSSGPVPLDTTVAHIPTLTAQWSAANAVASITCTDFLWGLGAPPSAS